MARRFSKSRTVVTQAQTDVELERVYRALNVLAADVAAGGSGGAPTNAQYFLGASNASLTSARTPSSSATISWDVSTANIFKANVIDASITDAKLRDSAALSVIGRALNSAGVPADIAAAVASTVLKRNAADALVFDKVDLSADVTGTLPAASVSGLGHNVLSDTHSDSLPAAAVFGDLIRAAPSSAATSVVKAWEDGLPYGQLPDANGAGDATYWLDGLPYDGIDATIVWQRIAAGASGQYLRMSPGGLPEWDVDPLSFTVGTYAPTWTGATTNPTIVNGSLVGQYIQLGKLVWFGIKLTIGSADVIATGVWSFTLPFTPDTTVQALFPAATNNFGVQVYPSLARVVSGTNTFKIFDDVLASAVSDVVPFAWGTSDDLNVSGWFVLP